MSVPVAKPKVVGKGAKEALGPVSKHGHKPRKGKGGAMRPVKTSGHIDPHTMEGAAVGHDHGSRGPFTKASKGKSKTK
jgi:hypothetical protein